jgi:SAM-dependent methyltransferase
MEGAGGEETMSDASSQSNDRYLMPRQPSEVNRLDLQHFALRELLGTNHLAPIGEPRSVLDVGTGTGQWAVEICKEFPRAVVVGADQAAQAARQGAVHYVRVNLLRGLPFADGAFEYVHQRLLRAGIPAAAWPGAIDELARVTAPEGLVEVGESGEHWGNAGPAAARFFGLMRELGARFGMDTQGPPGLGLPRLLGGAGLEEIGEQQVTVPIGEWGGRVGSFMASNLRAIGRTLMPVFASALGVPEEETAPLVSDMLREIEVVHMTGEVWYAWGRKPG